MGPHSLTQSATQPVWHHSGCHAASGHSCFPLLTMVEYHATEVTHIEQAHDCQGDGRELKSACAHACCELASVMDNRVQ